MHVHFEIGILTKDPCWKSVIFIMADNKGGNNPVTARIIAWVTCANAYMVTFADFGKHSSK